MTTNATATPSNNDGALHIALLGNPNCGKTALFNLMTGARQKVANYAGVTVERKEGWFTTPGGKRVRMLDLPGAYSLHAQSMDEAVTRDVLLGRRAGEPLPELVACVTDATHLRLNLRLVLEARNLGLPMVLVLNMSDMAKKQGIEIDEAVLSRELGVPVISTIAVKNDGAKGLLQWIDADQLKSAVPAARNNDAEGANTQQQKDHSAHAVNRLDRQLLGNFFAKPDHRGVGQHHAQSRARDNPEILRWVLSCQAHGCQLRLVTHLSQEEQHHRGAKNAPAATAAGSVIVQFVGDQHPPGHHNERDAQNPAQHIRAEHRGDPGAKCACQAVIDQGGNENAQNNRPGFAEFGGQHQ